MNLITGPFEWPEDAEQSLNSALGELYVSSLLFSLRFNTDFFLYSARAPTAELPNTAAFLGGLVAQEAIKLITRQYVPVKGYCVVDLIGSWTGTIDV